MVLETMREFSVLGCDPFAAFEDCLPDRFGRTHGYRDSASEKGKMSPIRYLLITAALLVFANWAIHGYRSGADAYARIKPGMNQMMQVAAGMGKFEKSSGATQD